MLVALNILLASLVASIAGWLIRNIVVYQDYEDIVLIGVLILVSLVMYTDAYVLLWG